MLFLKIRKKYFRKSLDVIFVYAWASAQIHNI